MKLADKAFTPRWTRIGSKYKTKPLAQALQDAFQSENLFGGRHENSSSYYTKVAVTATTETAEYAVILANYNRQHERQRKCRLESAFIFN